MLRLFVNIYTDPHPMRQRELFECSQRNRDCPAIGEVVRLEGRPTFNDFFAAIDEKASSDDDLSIIANADIWFGPSLMLAKRLPPNHVWALSRWDVSRDGSLRHFARADSQDCWMFRGKPKQMDADFTPGKRGCDNRLTAVFAEAGYVVSNPSRTVMSHHLHLTNIRRYGHVPADCVPMPYLLIPPHKLGEKAQLHWKVEGGTPSARPWSALMSQKGAKLNQLTGGRNSPRRLKATGELRRIYGT